MKSTYSPLRSAFLATLLGGPFTATAAQPDATLWYQQPATSDWMTALPLGNGRIGGMVFGGVRKERIMLNESSVWSGWPEPANDRPGADKALGEIRRLLREGRRDEAGKLAVRDFLSKKGYGKPDFGAYQAFCDAWLEFPDLPEAADKVVGYRRDLDLATGIASVSFTAGETDYRREYFCSYPDQALAARFTSSRKDRISFKLGITSPHKKVAVTPDGAHLIFSGEVENGPGNPPGVRFEARILVENSGGTVTTDGASLVVTGADSVILKIVAATNYQLAYPNYLGEEAAPRNIRTLTALKGRSFDTLREAHVSDHRRLFDRVTLEFADPEAARFRALPTDQRLQLYKKNRSDRGLEALVFQYGRYLLIASSRPGGLPANLQGIWNNSNNPAWNCDFHLNINFQMNYWPAGPCNLSECAQPMLDWLADVRQPGERTARNHYGRRGR